MKEKGIDLDELQSLGIKEFSLSSILNDGPNAGKQIRAVMRFLKNCGIMNRIEYLGEKRYILFTLHHSRWRYAPMNLVCNPPLKPKEEEC